jgi:hypothetical protein
MFTLGNSFGPPNSTIRRCWGVSFRYRRALAFCMLITIESRVLSYVEIANEGPVGNKQVYSGESEAFVEVIDVVSG